MTQDIDNEREEDLYDRATTSQDDKATSQLLEQVSSMYLKTSELIIYVMLSSLSSHYCDINVWFGCSKGS